MEFRRFYIVAAGIAIILAALITILNISPSIAEEQLPVPLEELNTLEAPVPEPIDQDNVSLARILIFERQIAGKRISEAEQRKIAENIVKYSRILGISPELGAALIAKESRFNPRASSRGYKGLGQLCASAARNNGVKNPFDIEQNVRATLSYLKQMMDIWEGKPDRIERALASYNSGARAVRSRGPGISRKFIKSVLKYHADIIAIDVSTVLSENTSGQPQKPAGEYRSNELLQ